MTSSLALALSLLAPLAAATPAEPRRPVDRVAAIVNGEVITYSEVVERASPVLRQLSGMRAGEAREKARNKALQDALDLVVTEKLLDAEVKSLGIDISESQVDAAIEDIKKRNKFDDSMLKQALAEQGLDLPTFRLQLRKNFEGYAVISQKVRSRLKVSDDDVQNYYQTHRQEFAKEDEVKVRHIFLPVPPSAAPGQEGEVRVQGEKVLARLEAGEDFAAVARAVSQGPSAAAGGDLGWLHRGSIQAELERVAFTLEPGKWSGLVRTKSGLHILKVEERRAGEVEPLASVKDRIRDRLGNDQGDVYRKQYLEELKRDATIEILLPELRSGVDPKAAGTGS